MIPIGPIIWVAARALSPNKGGTQTTGQSPIWIPNLAGVLWACLLCGWLFGFAILAAAIQTVDESTTASNVIIVVVLAAVQLGVALWLFAAFAMLRFFARMAPRSRFAHPKLIYYLAYVGLVCPRTGETCAGATLLAALALAHRGKVTPAEREWLSSRLAKETRALGTYATAHGFLEAISARAARDEGRTAEADDRFVRARAILGTVTYLSPRGVSTAVRALAHEWLAMSDAALGYWGSFHDEVMSPPPALFQAFRAWVREKIVREKPSWSEQRALRQLGRDARSGDAGGPAFDAWLARRPEMAPIDSAEAAARKAGETFATLMRGKAVAPRAALHMLAIYDTLLDPRCPDTVLPPAQREDETFVAGVQETLAESLANALALHGAPVYAMPTTGPVSSRVFQRLEVRVQEDLTRALTTIEERGKMGWIRRSPLDDWLDTSLLRALYRRLELTLGEPAAARVFPRFRAAYWKLALQLSEDYPRMRPLAHAAFAVLHRDAMRFNDAANIPILMKNMSVTRHIA